MNTFHKADKVLPANGRAVICFEIIQGNPVHSIVHFHKSSGWKDPDGKVVVVSLWSELPYPEEYNPTDMPTLLLR